MKYLNIIKLLTVLLCIGMLFVACDNTATEAESTEEVTTIETEAPVEENTTEAPTEAPTEEPATEEPLLGNVEGKFENFFEYLEAESGELSSAERVEGTIVSHNDNIVVFRSAEINAKNMVTETYNVYNIQKGEVILTVTNEYFNSECDEFDFFAEDFRVFESTVLVENDDKTFSAVTESDKTYRESYLAVQIVEDAWLVDFVLVAKAEITPIEDAVREENPEGCVYKVETTYSYYDAYGTLITESRVPLSIDPYNSRWGAGNVVAFTFGSEVVYFDVESGKFIKSGTALNDDISGVYEYENDVYGYYSVRYTYVLDGYTAFMDIVNKGSGKVLRYNFDNGYEDFEIFCLHNGDLLIQYVSEVDESEPYDFYSFENDEFTFYSAKTVILSVDDGKETVIEKPEFVIEGILSYEEYNEYFEGEYGIAHATDKARNIALIYNIKDGVISDVDDVVIFDNDLTVLYRYERIIEQQQLFSDSVLGFEVLANGDRLVEIGDEELPYAIVTPDGEVRAYLKATMRVVGEYVTDGIYLYDYDLNSICNYSAKAYTLVELFGECVFVSEYEGRCMTFEVYGETVYLDDLFEDDVQLIEYNDDYAVFSSPTILARLKVLQDME